MDWMFNSLRRWTNAPASTAELPPAPWGVKAKGEWTDHKDCLAAEWLQKQGILVSVEVAGQPAQTATRDRPFHPMKSYLQGLRWDGVERLERGLSTYLGIEDSVYSRAVGSRWLISAVARIFRPGAKAIAALSLKARKRSPNQPPSGRLPANSSRMNSPIWEVRMPRCKLAGFGSSSCLNWTA